MSDRQSGSDDPEASRGLPDTSVVIDTNALDPELLPGETAT